MKLIAEARKKAGVKKALSDIRAQAKIPAVIYGGGKPPVEIMLAARDLLDVRKKGGVNAVIELKVGEHTETVIVKALQRHPVTDRPVHADFQRISLTQKIEAKVPIVAVGVEACPGIKAGGVLSYELRELRVKALPTAIPQHIEVGISNLELHDHLAVKDLKLPTGVEVLDDAEHLVVSIATAKAIEVAAPAAAVPAAGAEGAAAPAAEPEIASTKGKKDEEGKLLPKDAKAAPAAGGKGAPAAAGKEPGKKDGK